MPEKILDEEIELKKSIRAYSASLIGGYSSALARAEDIEKIERWSGLLMTIRVHREEIIIPSLDRAIAIKDKYKGNEIIFPLLSLLTDQESEVVWMRKQIVKDFPEAAKFIDRLKGFLNKIRSLIRKLKKKIKVKELTISIGNFDFKIKENWDYKLKVETPTEWGAGTGDYRYGVKFRSLTFLDTFNIAGFYIAGSQWRNMTQEEINAKVEAGRQLPQRLRRLIMDPNNTIRVRRLKTGDRILWLVDFSNHSGQLASRIDLGVLERTAKLKGYGVSYD